MADLTEDALQKVESTWHGAVDQGSIVGGVLLLARHGKLEYASARGWTDREQGVRMQRQTRFRLASLSKLITSVTALRLCETGLLALDTPVTAWLDDFRPRLADGREPVITLRQLLSHTSGLSYGFEQPVGNAYQRAGVGDGLVPTGQGLQENLRRLAQVPLRFEPGSQWGYSLSTDVVGAVIERVTGDPLRISVKRWVTGPLGMTSTVFPERAAPADEMVATAYKDGPRIPQRIGVHDTLTLESGHACVSSLVPLDYDSGGAGMLGTADDYLRLLECLRSGGRPLLTPGSTALLLGDALGGIAMQSRGPGWAFGLGPAVLVDPVAAGQRQGVGTWSWCGVYGCHYWVDPQAGISLVALTNTAVAGAWGALADGLVDAIYNPED